MKFCNIFLLPCPIIAISFTLKLSYVRVGNFNILHYCHNPIVSMEKSFEFTEAHPELDVDLGEYFSVLIGIPWLWSTISTLSYRLN